MQLLYKLSTNRFITLHSWIRTKRYGKFHK